MGFLDIFRIGKFKNEIEELQKKYDESQRKLKELDGLTLYDVKEQIERISDEIKSKEKIKKDIEDEISDLNKKEKLIEKNINTQEKKLSKEKELLHAIHNTFLRYIEFDPPEGILKQLPEQIKDIDELTPNIMLKLHCMDVKDLRKLYRQNDKQIDSVLKKYASRYTTKANQAIYKLMVIALRAELQNVLYSLKYSKLDKSIDEIKSITQKYLTIASEGNQSIAGTMRKFIGEIEYLFINAVKIEYNYYVKKEQARQEQLAIREQMRQEAEEKKALEAERKKVEKEEAKYISEIEKAKSQLESVTDQALEDLKRKIEELESKLAEVALKKEEITNLANGKAGNVYIISNLGSFGKNVFKIGMTRRLNPQDRVNELGDASVPFKFDVHSFIFSDDAVGLENKLHKMMENKRVNKVNRRKEFFYTSIDELEKVVTEIDPTAEFNRTMLAEEFRQSLSTDEGYTDDYVPDFEEEGITA
ncbi:MAG: GIY-YIG nuclease family protein [Enterococcus sp.]